MEGIADGMAVDDCFYCAQLYPGLAPCPSCDNRFHYRVATMRHAEVTSARMDDAIAAYRREPGQESATALLTLWHELGEEADSLVRKRVALSELRAHFTRPSGEEETSPAG